MKITARLALAFIIGFVAVKLVGMCFLWFDRPWFPGQDVLALTGAFVVTCAGFYSIIYIILSAPKERGKE